MKKLFLFLTMLIGSVGVTWAQFTWTNSSTAITTDAWASSDNWTCADGTTFPTAGSGPMTTNSNAWAMVNLTNCSGSVADLEGWNPKMTLDATTLTVENMRKMQGDSKNFTLKNSSTLTITLHASNSGNDGGTVPITFSGNGNTFNLILAGDKGGDVTTVNYGTVTSSTTDKFNVSSSATGTAHTYNALTLKATLADAATSDANTLHSIVLGNISSDITVTTLTYDITAANFSKSDAVLTASDDDAGKYSVVKDATSGDITLYWVTGPNPAAVSLLEKAFAGTTNVNDGTLTVNDNGSTISTNSDGNILIYNASGVSTLDATSGTNRPASTVSFRINLATPTEFKNIFTWSTNESKTTAGNVGVGLSTDLKVQGTWAGAAWTSLSTGVLTAGSHIITVAMGQSDNSYGTRIYVDGKTTLYSAAGLKTSNTTFKYVVIDKAVAKRVNAMYIWNKALTADEIGTVATEIGELEVPAIFPDETKVYTIKSYTTSGVSLYYNGSNDYVFAGTDATDNDNHKWAIYTVDDKTYLYNIGAGKLAYQVAGTGSSTSWPLADNVAHSINVNKTGDYYLLNSEYVTDTYAYLHYNSAYTYGSTNWTAEGGNSKWTIEEAGELTDAQATAIKTMVNTYKFTLPETDKYYKITGIIGDVKEYISYDGTSRVASTTESSPVTTKDVWYITTGSASGKYYIKNAYDNTQYFGFDGVTTTAYDWQFEISTDATNLQMFSLYGVAKSRYLGVGTNNMVGNDLYAGSKQSNTTWNSYKYSTNFLIEPVDVYTLTINTTPAVAGVFTWNGTTKRGSSVTYTYLGDAITGDAATVSAFDNGYTATLSESTWDGTADLTITATMEPSFFSTDVESATWVRINNIRNSSYVLYANDGDGLHTRQTTSTEDELFALVGDATSFKLYSKTKKAYFGSADNNSGTAVLAGGTNNTFKLVSKTGDYAGYAIVPTGDESESFNMHGGAGNDIKYYAATDGGATWGVSAVQAMTLTIACTGTKSEMNQLVGSFSYTADGVTTNTNVTYASLDKTTTIYLPKAKNLTINDNSFVTYPGYTCSSHSLADNVLTVNYTATDARWLFQTYGHGRPYRIPAITKAKNNDLIAVSDDRFCGADIGNGRVDLVYKVSHDNGATWSAETMLAQGDGVSSSNTCGFGDAAIVADRTSDKVMVMCVSAPNGGTCWTAAQRSSITWGTPNSDGTWTWTTPVDFKDEIMALLPTDRVNYFVGSGKLHQSRYIKVGDYYRVYAALWTTAGSDINNYVVYSDNFGAAGSWKLLGTTDVCPGPNGNEPKCEELPDGSVLLSARQPYHRLHNIFTYTDAAKGEGSWGTSATGIANNDGPNGTDGEILIVNAKRASDGKIVPMGLQSAPNNGRAKVSIWYKDLSTDNAYDTPANFGTGWTLGKQMTPYSSAYTTMILQANNKIGFFYEDGQSGAGYDMIYVPLTLEELTGNAYSLATIASKAEGSTTAAAKVEGEVINPEAVTTLIDESATSVDLTSATVTGTTIEAVQKAVVEKTGNSNTLIYAPAGTTVQSETTNVVVDGKCQSLVVTDGSAFAAPTAFTATVADYVRTMTNQWGTLCLPYDIKADHENASYDLYTISGSTSDELTLARVADGTVAAGTPVLVYRDGAATGIDMNNSDGDINVATGVQAGTNELVGCLKPTPITSGYYISKDAFWNAADVVGGVTVPAFRAYINKVGDARTLTIRVAGGEETGIEALYSMINGTATYYDANGRQLKQAQQGVNIIRTAEGKTHKVILK